MKSLERYWPTDASVRDCLKVDAEAADPAVLLAVHQPMKLRRREFGAAVGPQVCNEEELLKALLAETGDGRVIVPIVGNSGVGKSHVIRWLDAQLQNAPGADRRVVHRISKGQSLKRILGALLERRELAGERFEKIRQRLENARERLSDAQAANLLCEVLAQSVAEASADAARKIHAGSTETLLKMQRDLGKVLPTLLREPALRDLHWIERPGGAKGCVARLVEQFTTSVEADREDLRKHQFEPSDLELSHAVEPRALSDLAQKALSVLQLHQPKRRAEVAAVLNAALDEAKKQVLGLETSISELFDEVRRELLESKKELVLLVEDFAVLSGMQKELLQAVIREGVRDGRQVLCTLRTALAYTEGSAPFLFDDTYRSRAKVEWLVPEAGEWTTEDDDRIVRLVGAYLNAARVGVKGLRKALEDARRDGTEPSASREWIPHPEMPETGSDQGRHLVAFGEVDGNALFPLNRPAIKRLVRDGCRKGADLVYNPRLILQSVLLKTLERRHEFVEKAFPAKDFRAEKYVGHAQIREKLPSRVANPHELERYVTVLAYWYEDASTWVQLEKKSPLILEAFDLSAQWKQGKGEPEPMPPKLPRPLEPQPQPPQPAPDEDLRKWSEGKQLGFDRSRKIRKQIAQALDAAIQWDWFCTKPRNGVEKFFESILLPRASGGTQNLTPADAIATPFTEEDLDHVVRGTSVVGQVKALARYLDGDSGWNYEGAELDAARYCALVEGSWAQAARFVLRRPVKEPEDLVPTLASGLAVSARALNVPGADSDDHASLSAALFDPGGRDAATPATEGRNAWSDAERAMSRWRGRPGTGADENWRSALLRLVGARQGGGSPLAVDAGKLKPVLDEVVQKWSIPSPPAGLEQFVAAGDTPTSDFNLKKFDLAKTLADEATRVSTWAGRVEAALGPIANPDDLAVACDAVDSAVLACRSAGLVVAKDADAVNALTYIVRSSSPVELLESARELAAAADTGTRLKLRARHDVSAEAILARWLDQVESLLGRAEGKVPHVLSEGAPDPVTVAREELAKALEALATEYEKGGQK